MKILNKIIIVIALVSLYSCEDAYDIDQVGLLESHNAIQSVDDVELNLLGVYDFLDNTTEIQFNGVYSDEFGIGNTNGGQNLDELGLVLTAASAKPETIWINNYLALAQANKMISSALTIIAEDASEQTRLDNALGQAYAIRAYLHLKLQTYFSADLTDDNALGVIALDFVPEPDEFLPRSSNLAVFTMIENDLNTAENLLTANSGVTFMNIDVVNAIRARMYTYRGDYTTAATYAAPLLASYPISGQATFTNMFLDTADGEVIFKLERTIGDNYDNQGTTGGGFAGSLFSFVDASATGGLFLEMGRSLFNKLLPSDVRYNVYVHPTSIVDPAYTTSPNYRESDVLAINKYAGSEGRPLMNDLKIFRSSEMLFILAEAAAENGNNLAGAATLLTQLRTARLNPVIPIVPPVYADAEEAFADILAERRLELAFEGHRWVDLKRLGVVANVTIDKDPLDCAITGGCTMPANDYRFVAPIPLRELDLNSSLSQNPNY